MDGILKVFNGILYLDSKDMNLYIDALYEHQSFKKENASETDNIVGVITSLLTNKNKRLLGLEILYKLIDQFTLDMIECKVNLWITIILKSLNSNELASHSGTVFAVLGKLVIIAHQSPELSKSFVTNHLGKIFEYMPFVAPSSKLASLNFLAICLSFYSGFIGPYKGNAEKIISVYIDTKDENVSTCSGKCMLLLQQVCGNKINCKTQWQNYQQKLLINLHYILNHIFENTKLHKNSIEQGELIQNLVLNDEPFVRASQLYIRFRNLINYLIIALREPFPVEKPIMPKKILNFIERGLLLTYKVLEQNPISENLVLGILLPKIHLNLLELLLTLIKTLQSQSRIYHQYILRILLGILKSTSNHKICSNIAPFSLLRVKTYDIITDWCAMLRSGSRCEIIVEYLVDEIIKDALPLQMECTLQVANDYRKHISKTTRQHLHKVRNQQSNFAQINFNNSVKKNNNRNTELCISALRCLQQILYSSSTLLKPNIIKVLQHKIFEVCGLFYEPNIKYNSLYTNWNCRYELYNILYIMLITAHPLSPPPSQFAITLLQRAFTTDDVYKIRNQCGKILITFEKVLHPQKESLFFPIKKNEQLSTGNKWNYEYVLNRCSSNNTNNEEITMEQLNCDSEDDIRFGRDTKNNSCNNATSYDKNVEMFPKTTFENEVNNAQLYSNQPEMSKDINTGEIAMQKTINFELNQPISNLSDLLLNSVKSVKRNEDKYNETPIAPLKKIKLQENKEEFSEFRSIEKFTNNDMRGLLLLDDIESAFVDELS